MASKRGLKLTLIIEEDFVAEALKEAAQDRDLTTTQMALEIIRDWYLIRPLAAGTPEIKSEVKRLRNEIESHDSEYQRQLTEERKRLVASYDKDPILKIVGLIHDPNAPTDESVRHDYYLYGKD